MQVIESFEACKIENGSKRIFVKYIVVDRGTLYIGNWSDRQRKPTTLDQLENRQIVQTQNRGPPLSPEWTIAHPSSHLYEKKPSLEEFVNPALEASIAHEIAMCEIVRHHPHPNLATYYGCVADDRGKASGLLFEKYERSLLETVNPIRLSKSDFVSSGRLTVSSCMRDWLLPLRAAVDHLHSIGYVHNDITPQNIMLDSQGQPVIIDFGSMCRVGEALDSYKRTMEWHDPTVSHARLSNDHNALREIETWLSGSVHDLLFK